MSTRHLERFDFWSLVVITLTLALFLVAIFIKGMTHELLQETGVFLVSVKLILLSHKNSMAAERTDEHLRHINTVLQTVEKQLTHSD
jgi:hypothetical protein